MFIQICGLSCKSWKRLRMRHKFMNQLKSDCCRSSAIPELITSLLCRKGLMQTSSKEGQI